MKHQILKGQKTVQANEARRLDDIFSGDFDIGCGVAIDGGAHVGSFTIPLSFLFDTVYAFEPCGESFEFLEHNTEAYGNAGCSIEVYEAALMDKVCNVHVRMPSDKRKALTARQVDYGGDVPAVSIDSLNLKECDFIKLDLEGAEYMALDGARGTIEECRPALLVEMNNLGGRFGNSDQSLQLCIEGMGYKCVWSKGVDKLFKAKR